MRNIITAVAVLAAAVPAVAVAQSSVEGRVGKLEGEMRAVQRKVFPGGAGPYLEPQITPGDAPVAQAPGTPASSAVIDLSSRVSSLEGQMATLTGQIEQSQYRLRQLEEQFATYRKTTDARFTEGTAVPPPATTGTLEGGPAPRPTPRVTPPVIATRDPAQVADLQRPATDDPAEDSYLFGYRLWNAKKYPEAEAQLKKTVADFPMHRRASYAQNLLGRSYLDEGKPSLASIAFYDNYKKRPDGERAPDSLYFLGQALVKLGKPADACKVYGELTDVYGTKIDATMTANVEKGRVAAKCK